MNLDFVIARFFIFPICAGMFLFEFLSNNSANGWLVAAILAFTFSAVLNDTKE